MLRKLARVTLNVLTALSLVLCVAVVAFFLGKRFGYDGNPMPATPLYWLRWRADGLYWLSAGRVFGIDLELVLATTFAVLPFLWICWHAIDSWPRLGTPAGLCMNCGYDLRATPGRCPECGARCGRAPRPPNRPDISNWPTTSRRERREAGVITP